MPQPLLSVIVCTFNRANLLPFSLRALSEQTLDQSAYEILIIDNNSTDHTRQVGLEFIHQHPNVRYFLEPQQGLSHARNRGCQEARGQYVAYVDDDAKADPAWGERIVAVFERVVPQPLAVGGPYFPWYESKPPRWFTEDFEKRYWGNRAKFLDTKQATLGLSGSNMAFPKEVLSRFGPFSTDEGIMKRNLGEEADLFHRIFRSGIREKKCLFWYDPAIVVHHWTPLRNAEIGYRTRRAFKSGLSVAHIKNTTLASFDFAKSFAYLFLLPGKSLLQALHSKDLWKTQWVRFLQNFFYVLGYLRGSLSQTINKR